MKFGLNMHLGIENSSQLGAMQKSVVSTIFEDFRFPSLCSVEMKRTSNEEQNVLRSDILDHMVWGIIGY